MPAASVLLLSTFDSSCMRVALSIHLVCLIIGEGFNKRIAILLGH